MVLHVPLSLQLRFLPLSLELPTDQPTLLGINAESYSPVTKYQRQQCCCLFVRSTGIDKVVPWNVCA